MSMTDQDRAVLQKMRVDTAYVIAHRKRADMTRGTTAKQTGIEDHDHPDISDRGEGVVRGKASTPNNPDSPGVREKEVPT